MAHYPPRAPAGYPSLAPTAVYAPQYPVPPQLHRLPSQLQQVPQPQMSKKRDRNASNRDREGLVPPNSGLLPQLQNQAEEALRAAKRRKPVDKTLPTFDLPTFLREENLPKSAKDSALYEGVKRSTDVLKGLGDVHERLRVLEKRMDWQISRKRLELQDQHTKDHSCERLLKVDIEHEPRFQAWQVLKASTEAAQKAGANDISLDGTTEEVIQPPDFEKETGIPGFDLRISGKLLPLKEEERLDDEEDEIGEKKFTEFIKGLKVELLDRDENLHTDSNTAEWNPSSSAATSGFTIRRASSSSLHARISISINHSPERFKVRQPLSSIVMVNEGTRERCVMGLWSYIKKKGLHDAEDKRLVRCDDALKAICNGAEKVQFGQIGDIVVRHLLPLDPVTIEYTIDLSESCAQRKRTFTIPIAVPSPLTTLLGRCLSALDLSSPSIQAIIRADSHLSSLYTSLRSHATRREFYAYFALSPITFLQTWMNSQAFDLGRLIEGTTRAEVSLPAGGDEHERRRFEKDETWTEGQWIEEAAMVWEQRGQVELIQKRTAAAVAAQGRK
ncbi:hypothetical protein BT69DRAFT_1349317 [Atractiella rhizophila]|nr:hypothetical protein BT69DRAFT_1349317 [Atractiella rhizophila]